MMQKSDRIFVAGGSGLVGSAIVRRLRADGFKYIVAPPSAQLNLMNEAETLAYIMDYKPHYVFMAAAKVGGIWANNNYPVEFCVNNLRMELNVFQAAYRAQVRKLMFLGSSCIYPKNSPIPIQEASLLTGPLEPTNEGYALAKITAVRLCDYYRRQYGADFISVMPTNTFGENDNFDPVMGHMLPSLIYKFHQAKIKGDPSVSVWGTGNPRREVLYVDDLADGALFLMNHYSAPGPINLGTGLDYSIREIAERIRDVVGFRGELVFDTSKPDGVFRKVMDVERVLKMGWQAKTPLEEALRRTYQWFAENYENKKVIQVHPTYKKKSLMIQSPKLTKHIKLKLIHPKLLNKSLDDADIPQIHREVILAKPFLRKTYQFHYEPIVAMERTLENVVGKSLELGSGGSFLKNILPNVITSDVHQGPGVDQIEDAYQLSFKDGELKAIYMTGVLHHLGRPREFFAEARRCLRPGGYIVMMEPHMSAFGRFFFKRLHHEANMLESKRWEFPQTGPLSSANTALPHIIFDRDYAAFQREFPELQLVTRTYHTFLIYGLSGGVSFRFSAPGWTFPVFSLFEKILQPWMRKYLGTMQTIVLQKTKQSQSEVSSSLPQAG